MSEPHGMALDVNEFALRLLKELNSGGDWAVGTNSLPAGPARTQVKMVTAPSGGLYPDAVGLIAGEWRSELEDWRLREPRLQFPVWSLLACISSDPVSREHVVCAFLVTLWEDDTLAGRPSAQ